MLSLKKITAFFSVVFGAFLLSGCGFKTAAPEGYSVSLEVWGVFDDSDAYTQVFNEYRKIDPYVREIKYRKMPIETYKSDLLDALASGKGPDIFMIRNSWRSAFQDKIVPAPETMLTEKQYRDALVDVAAFDFIGNDKKIYGVPLSVDSLALYYNKDLFNAAGIVEPPKTWEEVLQDVSKLNRVDQNGNITQSGAALGTAYNINRSTDILAAMMMQSGSKMSDEAAKSVSFSNDGGNKAFDFYTQFANAGSGFYSWNPRLHYSIDAFFEGTLGMMVNYSWQYATIKQKNAKLNIGVAPLPQFAGTSPVNLANYWGYVVAKNKEYQAPAGQASNVSVDLVKQNQLRVHEAWQFLKFFAFAPENKSVTLTNGLAGTTKTFPMAIDPAETYLKGTMKPAARRDLIDMQKNDVVLSPFASGNLIARDWYQADPEAVEGILAEMIDSVNKGAKSSYDALSTASSRIRVLMR